MLGTLSVLHCNLITTDKSPRVCQLTGMYMVQKGPNRNSPESGMNCIVGDIDC